VHESTPLCWRGIWRLPLNSHRVCSCKWKRLHNSVGATVSYKNIGDAGRELLKDLAESGVRVKVPTTVNPAAIDLRKPGSLGDSPSFREAQTEVLKSLQKMGASLTLTCTPYTISLTRPGAHVAWGESSAVCFANSFLEMYTNRESGITSIAAAIIGKTPEYGMHLDENRKPEIEVELRYKPQSDVEYAALGYLIGSQDVQVAKLQAIEALPWSTLKLIASAAAASGRVSMLTSRGAPPHSLSVTKQALIEVIEALSSASEAEVAAIGCPHLTLPELKQLACMLRGRNVARGRRIWAFTSPKAFAYSRELGILQLLERAGVEVFSGACPVVAPIENLPFSSIATNSAKAAHYIPSLSGKSVMLVSLKEIVQEFTS